MEVTVIVGNCLKYGKVAVQRPFNFTKGLPYLHTYVYVFICI